MTSVGAPWLYLLHDSAHAFHEPKVESHILAMPGHRNELATAGHHEKFANVLVSQFNNSSLLVLLHGLDFMTWSIREVYRARGLRIESAGWPVISVTPRPPSSGIGDRQQFLPNLMTAMRNASCLVTDSMGTHVLYAGTLGLDVIIWPVPEEAVPFQASAFFPHAATRSALFAEATWQEENLGKYYRQTLPQQVMQDLVADHLGVESFRTPEELQSVLKWKTAKSRKVSSQNAYAGSGD